MNVRDVSNDGLRQTLNQWLEKGEQRSIIEQDPLLAANLPHLAAARDAFDGLTSTDPLTGAERARIEAALQGVNAEIVEVDGEFDDAGRAGHTLIETAALLSDDDELRASLLEALKRLYPRGLSVLNLSADEEAGVALGMKTVVDDGLKGLLSRIELKVGGQKASALSLVETQIGAGKRLGKLVATRNKIIAERDAAAKSDDHDTQELALARFGKARSTIVSAVSDFIHDIERARHITQAQRLLLLATIDGFSSKATRRAKKGKQPAPQG